MAQLKNQGRMARMAVFWSLAALLFFGATWLHTELKVSAEFFRKSLIPGVEKLPFIGAAPSLALLIAAAILIFGLLWLNKWVNKPNISETLTETENEMRKVTWPTLDEAINGSFVVIVAVLFLMAFLAGTDYVLTRITHRFLLGLIV